MHRGVTAFGAYNGIVWIDSTSACHMTCHEPLSAAAADHMRGITEHADRHSRKYNSVHLPTHVLVRIACALVVP